MHNMAVFVLRCSVTSGSWQPHGFVAHQASLSMGFSRQEYWCRLPFLSTGDLPDPGIKPASPYVSCIVRQILYHLSQVQCLMQKEWHTDGIVDNHIYSSVLSHSLLFACLFYSLTHPFIYLLICLEYLLCARDAVIYQKLNKTWCLFQGTVA